MGPHLQRDEELGVRVRGQNLLDALRVEEMLDPVVVKPARQAVRRVLAAVPLRLELLEGRVGDAMGGAVYGRFRVAVAAEAQLAVEDGRAREILPVQTPVPVAAWRVSQG